MAAGNYTLTITDQNNCTAVIGPLTITQTPAITLATPTTTNVSCNGGSTGSIVISPTGGTAPYTYAWSNGTTAQNLTNVPAGNYSVTISDNAGCSRLFGPYPVTEPVAVTAVPNITDASCNGASTGGIILGVTGGTGPYTYAWSNGATTKDISALATGSYSVTITDNNGCPKIFGPFTVSQPTAIIVAYG